MEVEKVARKNTSSYIVKSGLGSEHFGEHWVYYERLRTDFNGKYYPLYKSIKNLVSTLPDIDSSKAYENVLNMAKKERQKEIQALKRVFGESASSVNLENINTKELVECFNVFLSTSERFQRNLALIKNTQGQKNVTSFFDFYFEKVFNSKTDELEKLVLENPKAAIDLAAAVKEALDPKGSFMQSIIMEATKEMAKAELESGIKGKIKDEDKLKKAYLEIVEDIDRLEKNKNPYISQVTDLYKLNDLVDLYSNSLRLTQKGSIDKRNIKLKKGATVKTTGSKRASISGEYVEIFEEALVNTLGGKRVLHKDKSLQLDMSLEAKRVGHQKGATDVMAFVGIPQVEIDDLTKFSFKPDKDQRVKAFTQFTDRLKNYQDGLIVHISSKNYSLNQGFIERGGYGTTQMTPQKLDDVLKTAGINVDNLISLIVQLCKGAIGYDMNIQTEIENDIAQYFAYIFFDDVQAIGNEMTKHGANSIHVLDLNGVEVPLSVFLDFLADAIKKENTKATVRIDINAPNILYDEDNRPAKESDWIEQRNDALKNTKISTHFLSNIKEFFSNF